MEQSFTMAAFTGLMSTFATLLIMNFEFPPLLFDTDTPPGPEYDFIVVGCGTAGSVVATRLSETGASVLVLEAGDNIDPLSLVPAGGVLTDRDARQWFIRAKPQKNAMLGFVNNSTAINQYKVIGGASSMNGMMFARGSPEDYNNWANMGNEGWDFESVLPYFKKLETFENIDDFDSGEYRGTNGPINVQVIKQTNIMSDAFLEAAEVLGNNVIDPNGKSPVGFALTQVAIKDGVRQTGPENYLRMAMDKPNLLVVPNAFVTRILFNSDQRSDRAEGRFFFNEDKRADAVEYMFKGEKHVARANKEIILSAGPVQNPKILMLSGVGPVEELQKFDIPIVAGVEGVGKNLQDHPTTVVVFKVAKGSGLNIKNLISPKSFLQYIKTNTGDLANALGEEGNAWLHLGDDNPEWVDVWLQLTSFNYPFILSTASLRFMKLENINSIAQNLGLSEAMVLVALLARPKSKGSVTLNTTNYQDVPIVDLNLFSDEDDLDLAVKGIRAAYDIAYSKVMQDAVSPVEVSMPIPGCRHFPFRSDKYWRCYCRHTTFGGYHLTSTMKMAPDSDPLGVVSPRLSVRGVTRLRVADVSIMPEIVTSNTMAAAYMIGEKAADLIKEDWGYPTDTII